MGLVISVDFRDINEKNFDFPAEVSDGRGTAIVKALNLIRQKLIKTKRNKKKQKTKLNYKKKTYVDSLLVV